MCCCTTVTVRRRQDNTGFELHCAYEEDPPPFSWTYHADQKHRFSDGQRSSAGGSAAAEALDTSVSECSRLDADEIDEASLVLAFRVIDRNGDGLLTRSEARTRRWSRP